MTGPAVAVDVPLAGGDDSFEPHVTMMRLVDLHEHPRQQELFDDLPPSEFAALVEDLRRNGQTTRIRVLRDGTILCGTQRVRAARELGWDCVQAIVVDVENDGEAIRVLVEDNLHRRHLGPIALARLYEGLAKLAAVEGHVDGVDLRDEVAQRIGDRCGRTFDRYRRLLKLPAAIIGAVESGSVTITAGLEILKLPEKDRAKIAEEIEAGASAQKVVARHLRRDTRGKIVEMRKRYRQMQVVVRNAIDAIGSDHEDVVGFGFDYKNAVAVAQDGRKFFDRLLAAEKRRQTKCDANLARLFNQPNRKPTKRRRSK
jgi:ParB-like chromosome segregation protein Spo0J